MNVTGIEWRGPDPRESKSPVKRPPRRAVQAEEDDTDVVAIHGAAEEETADGLDEFE
jgi:hypothetical protein